MAQHFSRYWDGRSSGMRPFLKDIGNELENAGFAKTKTASKPLSQEETKVQDR